MAETYGTNPHHGRAGRHPTRKFLDSLKGHDDPGMFGRMFPNLPPLEVADGPLQALAEAMRDANPASPEGNNPKIPAGFTYLGQFVDHDITLDLTSIGEKERDPLATENFSLASRRSIHSQRRTRRSQASCSALNSQKPIDSSKPSSKWPRRAVATRPISIRSMQVNWKKSAVVGKTSSSTRTRTVLKPTSHARTSQSS